MKRIAIRSLIIGALGFVTVAAAAGWALNTAAGLQFVWQRIEVLAGPALAVESVEGTLAGPLLIRNIQLKTDSTDFAARTLGFDWNPWYLLTGTLLIDFIEGDGIRYRQRPDPAADTPIVLPKRVSFPLLVRLGELRLSDSEVFTGADAGSLVMKKVSFGGSLSGTRLSLQQVVFEAPGLSLTGAAGMRLSGDYPLHAKLDWHAQFDDYAPLNARTQVSGTLQELSIIQRLDSPYAADAELKLRNPLGKLHIDGDVVLRSSNLSAINSAWPAMLVNASLAAHGPPGQLRLGGMVASDSEEFGRLEAKFESELRASALLVRSLHVSVVDGLPEIQSQGRIGFGAAAISLDLTAEWQHLVWPLSGAGVVASKKGSLALRGTADSYAAEAQAHLDVPTYFAGQVSLEGGGDLQSFTISRMDAAAYDGNLQGSAKLMWAHGFRAEIDLSGSALNPGVLWPDWPGNVDGQLITNIAVTDADWSIQFDRISVDGALRSFPVQLDARGAYRGGQLDFDDVSLLSGNSRASIRGKIGATLDLEWEHEDLELALFLPEASGRVSGKGRARGTPATLQLKSRLAGKDLRYRLDRIDTFDLDAKLDLANRERSKIVLSIGRSHLAGVSFRNANLDVTGYPRQHELMLEADTNLGTASIRTTGAWDTAIWTYNLSQADLTYPRLAPWKLIHPVAGRISQTQVYVPESCWSSSDTHVCLNVAWSEEKTAGAFRLDRMPFGYFSEMLPTTTDIRGFFNANGSILQPQGGAARVRVELETTAGNITMKDIAVNDNDETTGTLLAFDPVRAVLNIDGQEATLDANLPLAEAQGELTLRARAQTFGKTWEAARLDGNLTARLPDIAFAGRLMPDVSSLKGQIDGAMDLSGTVAAPHLQGELALTKGAVTLDTPGLTLDDVVIRLSGQRSGDIRLDAKAQAGGGKLIADGYVRPFDRDPAAEIRIKGERFQVVDTPEAEIYVSPDLQVATTGRKIDVNGKIEIPRASIQPRRLPKSAVTVSSDQVIAEEGHAKQSPERYRIYTRVRFVLGQDVRFDGLGLKGKLGGNVLATGEPGRPTSATGELNVTDGKYRAYGQDLDIRTGRLLFAGGIVTEPGLDIEAVRRPAADVLVGVKVRGSLRAPEFSLFSDPTMSQSEQLSWLVLGRPLESDASSSERSALNEAALMLGLTGGEAIGKELAQTFGIDEISVGSEPGGTTTQASLLVGKYLTPELFVSYGIGIFEPVSTLKLRYTLTSRWKLVGEASALRSAADLFYVIEKGD